MTFKNDKERLAFLDDYTNESNGWFLWKQDEDLSRRFWKVVLPDLSEIIVEEERRLYHWPEDHITWAVIHWYIDKGGAEVFSEYIASRTQALAHLKEVLKG